MVKIAPHTLGFTLIELLVTIMVSAVVLTIAVPSFKELVDSNRVATSTNTLVATLGFAKSEAVKSGISVSTRRKGSTSQNWDAGWDVFTDVDNDGTLDNGTDTLLKTYEALPTGFTLRTGSTFANAITYEATGLIKGSAGDTFTLCNSSGVASKARDIVVNNVGRAYTKKGTTSCP